MKKLIYLLGVGIVSIIDFAQFFDAQENRRDNYERKLQVQMQKSNFVLFEPMSVRFDLTLPITDGPPRIAKAVSVRTTFEGKSKEFSGLTLNVSQGEPQAMPTKNSPSTITNVQPKSADY